MKRFKNLFEQHREVGRFKPVIPHNVKAKGIGPRPSVDSANVKLKEASLDKSTPSVEEIAKKHNVSVDAIEKQLEMGLKVEKEHTSKVDTAREIALDHLNEKPDYYSKLKKYVEMTDMEYQSAGSGAKTLVDKPNREPMKTLKQTIKQLNNRSSMKEEKKDEREYDYEGEMLKSDLRSIVANANRLIDMLEDSDNLPEWCQSKITLAEDYVSTVANYMTAEMNEEVDQVEEETVKWVADPLAGRGRVKFNKTPAGKERERIRHQADLKDKMKFARSRGGLPGPKGKLPEEVEQIDELSTDLLGRYKKAAGAQASAADKEGDFAKGNKRFSGIVKATKKQFKNETMKKEEVEYLEEKNKPTNPELWSRAVSMAKQKFDVYPSAYANGWAAKWYKSKGGDWKSVNEEANDKPPFEGGHKPEKKAVAGKYGSGYSTARHLARTALKKQAEKLKPVKESLEESRKTEIVKEIIKKKKNEMSETDKFEKEPILSDTISKE
jgi:hypothetical protein